MKGQKGTSYIANRYNFALVVERSNSVPLRKTAVPEQSNVYARETAQHYSQMSFWHVFSAHSSEKRVLTYLVQIRSQNSSRIVLLYIPAGWKLTLLSFRKPRRTLFRPISLRFSPGKYILLGLDHSRALFRHIFHRIRLWKIWLTWLPYQVHLQKSYLLLAFSRKNMIEVPFVSVHSVPIIFVILCRPEDTETLLYWPIRYKFGSM